jgi:hypothetical protein
MSPANGGFLKSCRYLLYDRASLFSEDFRMILKAAGIESVRLPARIRCISGGYSVFVTNRLRC